MKSMVINKQYPLMLLALILTGMITIGCGSDPKSDCSAPSDATITVTGPGTVAAMYDTAFNFTAVVQYADGELMPQACLTISSAFAYPRNAATSGSRYTFYALSEGDANPANYPVDNGFSAQTDDFGQYTFSAMYTGGTGSFKDTVTVRSGAVIGTADFEVQ